jgi:hypothetical protein
VRAFCFCLLLALLSADLPSTATSDVRITTATFNAAAVAAFVGALHTGTTMSACEMLCSVM